MKKLPLIIVAAALTSATAVQARTNLDVRGLNYTVDTIFHAKVGPGTTHTQLRLEADIYPLDVFYLTVDKSTPGVSIRTVCSTDMVAGNERTSAMAQRKSKDGLFYFGGSNGDFYSTSGTSTNGKSVVGTPTTSTTVDREIYKTSNSNYQFSVDTEGVARVCRLNYYTGTATKGQSVTLFKGVNVSSPANGITLYTPRYWGSANQNDYAGACHQVTARLAADSEPFYAGGKFRLEVTSEPSTDGDLAVPDDGYVIHGRGNSTSGCNTGADDFVAALKPGDIVDFDNIILTPEGLAIHPTAIVSGNPKNVGFGETLDTEGERGDASARHPRTSIGVSEDGNKIIMMVVDGRSSSSVGVTTSMLADIMRFAGAYEAVNLDGGGSSTLYTAALGVRNHCSDGQERAVGNGVFAVLEAPEDNEVAEIAMCDWAKTIPYYGVYKPVVYGFNKYGKLIDTDLKGFTLECEGGTISEDGSTLTATHTGTFALKATYKGATASIPVTVSESAEVAPKYTSVVLNSAREWPVDLTSTVNGTAMPVSPVPFEWTVEDPEIATIDSNGVVRGIAEGTTTITGTLGDNVCSVTVNVQIPTHKAMAVERTGDVSAWTVSGTSLSKNITATILENGLAVDFTLSSTRGPALTARLAQPVYSLPEAIRIRVNPGDTKVTKVITTIKANNEVRTVQLTHDTQLPANEESVLTYNLSDIFDTEGDLGVFPITFQSVQFYLGGSTKTPYHIDIPGIEGVYADETLGVDDIATDAPAANASGQWYNLQGIPVEKTTQPGLYIAPGQKILVK